MIFKIRKLSSGIIMISSYQNTEKFYLELEENGNTKKSLRKWKEMESERRTIELF